MTAEFKVHAIYMNAATRYRRRDLDPEHETTLMVSGINPMPLVDRDHAVEAYSHWRRLMLEADQQFGMGVRSLGQLASAERFLASGLQDMRSQGLVFHRDEDRQVLGPEPVIGYLHLFGPVVRGLWEATFARAEQSRPSQRTMWDVVPADEGDLYKLEREPIPSREARRHRRNGGTAPVTQLGIATSTAYESGDVVTIRVTRTGQSDEFSADGPISSGDRVTAGSGRNTVRKIRDDEEYFVPGREGTTVPSVRRRYGGLPVDTLVDDVASLRRQTASPATLRMQTVARVRERTPPDIDESGEPGSPAGVAMNDAVVNEEVVVHDGRRSRRFLAGGRVRMGDELRFDSIGQVITLPDEGGVGSRSRNLNWIARVVAREDADSTSELARRYDQYVRDQSVWRITRPVTGRLSTQQTGDYEGIIQATPTPEQTEQLEEMRGLLRMMYGDPVDPDAVPPSTTHPVMIGVDPASPGGDESTVAVIERSPLGRAMLRSVAHAQRDQERAARLQERLETLQRGGVRPGQRPGKVIVEELDESEDEKSETTVVLGYGRKLDLD